MTAHDLIADILSRTGTWQDRGMPANTRRVTPEQRQYLLSLIGQDEEGGALKNLGGEDVVWMPSGRNKYIIREHPRGRCFVLEKLSNVVPSGSGLLF